MKIEIKILNKKLYSDKETGSFLSTKFMPSYTTLGSAAVDLICPEDVILYPGETKAIHTGLAIHIGSNVKNTTFIHNKECIGDLNIAGLILPRSGLGSQGLIIANTIGLIDEDYQGELIVHVWNRLDKIKKIKSYNYDDYETDEVIISEDFIELKKGDRFAQLVFVPVIKTQWQIVEEFSRKTNRGEGGFGSTGE